MRQALGVARLLEENLALRAHCGGRIRDVSATRHRPSPRGCRPQNPGLSRDSLGLRKRELTDARHECAFQTRASRVDQQRRAFSTYDPIWTVDPTDWAELGLRGGEG